MAEKRFPTPAGVMQNDCMKELCELESISQREPIFVLSRISGIPLLVVLLHGGNGSRTMGNVQNATVFCFDKPIFSSSKAEGLRKNGLEGEFW